MREGTLIVVVSRASNLHNKRNVSKQNPFCAVRIQNNVHKTKTISRGGQNPAWDFECRFTLHKDLDSRFLKVSVFDQNGSNVDLVGDCTVDLAPVYASTIEEGYDAWHKICFGGKYTGEVYLETTFYPKRRRRSRQSMTASMNASMSASMDGSLHASHRVGLSPSVSMSSLSSVGSSTSRRPLPGLPGSVSASSPSLPMSRSPSPLRQSYSSKLSQSSFQTDPNTSLPAGLGSSSGSRRSRPELDANTSMPDLRPSMYGSRPMTTSASTHDLHATLKKNTFNPYAAAGFSHTDVTPNSGSYYSDSDSDLEIPEPPQHTCSANTSFNTSDYIDSIETEPRQEILENKKVSHINAWYGKAMFQRFRK